MQTFPDLLRQLLSPTSHRQFSGWSKFIWFFAQMLTVGAHLLLGSIFAQIFSLF